MLVGMTMSYAPVQAGFGSTVLERTKNIVKNIVKTTIKATKIGVASVLFVGGAACTGLALDSAKGTREGFIRDGVSFRILTAGAALSTSLLGVIFLYKELFSDNSNEQKENNDKQAL